MLITLPFIFYILFNKYVKCAGRRKTLRMLYAYRHV
nr:MAG TPA: hypothetical protein [Caudoviricetes sp.]